MAQTGTEFDPTAPLIGTVLGRHQLVAKLGEGGMGSVYRGAHVALGIHRAIKVMADEMCGDRRLRARFFREARLAARIKHRRVVEIIEVAPDEEARPYLVMKLEEGPNLGPLVGEIAARGSAREIRAIIVQILEGLSAIHARRIVHRDVKPDNFILRGWDTARREVDLVIVDFGIGKEIAPLGGIDPARTDVTKAGTVTGTPQYMPPEMIRPGTPVDARTDLYAVGCILYELCAGTAPFAHLARTPDTTANALAHMSGHLSMPPPEPARLPHAGFGPIIRRLLKKDPAERFQNAKETIDALLAINLDVSVGVSRAASAALRSPPQARRARFGAFAGGVVVVALLAAGIAAAFYLRSGNDAARPVAAPKPAAPVAAESQSVAPEAPAPAIATERAPDCLGALGVIPRGARVPPRFGQICADFCRATPGAKIRVGVLYANHGSRAPVACR